MTHQEIFLEIPVVGFGHWDESFTAGMVLEVLYDLGAIDFEGEITW